MALRKILPRGEEILSKKCKQVSDVNDRIKELCFDLVETMEDADGVGLAAPQVGVVKRIFVARPHIDDEDESIQEKIYYMINPEITYTEGHQDSSEGCLSVPGYMGLVDRPFFIKIRAQDLDGKMQEYEFSGFPTTVMCHEYDHLDGILYCDKAKDFMTVEEYQERLDSLREEHNKED